MKQLQRMISAKPPTVALTYDWREQRPLPQGANPRLDQVGNATRSRSAPLAWSPVSHGLAVLAGCQAVSDIDPSGSARSGRSSSARRRFGSIRKLASGRYQARYKHDGMHHPAPHTFKAKADANAWLAEVQMDLRRGVWIDPKAGQVSLALSNYPRRSNQESGHPLPLLISAPIFQPSKVCVSSD